MFRIDSKGEFNQQIVSEFFSVLILIVDKLNLNIVPQEDKELLSTCWSWKPQNEEDFRGFTNLVDFLIEILVEMEIVQISNWIEKLLTYFIKCSYKYPKVSGFYKLVQAIFNKLDVSCDYSIYCSKYTCELISQYLSDVLQLVVKFSYELQSCCIHLIFSAPLSFIADKMDEMLEIFEIAFKIGRSDLSLASRALETLESWTKNCENQHVNDCKNLVVHLEPYFTEEEAFVKTYQSTLENNEDKGRSSIIPNNDTSLETVRKKILLFYSTLDYEASIDLARVKTLETDASWIKKNLAVLEINFPYIDVNIPVDIFIDRIIGIIKKAEKNRRTKFSALKLLHIIISVILGKHKLSQCFSRNFWSSILKLACDPDDAVRNLYHTLVIQFVHYLSMDAMIQSRESQEFVESLFDGLTNEFNTWLRDYCGVCLHEFVEWMIIQSRDLSKSSYMTNLVNRIIDLVLDPASTKRLAGVMTFKSLFEFFGALQKNTPNTTVLNKYFFDLFCTFVESLEMYDDVRINRALDNLKIILEEKYKVFVAKSPSRRRLDILRTAAMWLFRKCGSLNMECREKCIELFDITCGLLKYESAEDFVKSCGAGYVDYINEIALANLEENLKQITISNVKPFVRSLDFYIWIFGKGMVSPGSVLIVENSQKGVFFQFFTKFVSIVVNRNIEVAVSDSTDTLSEAEELIDLVNRAVIKIFQFIATVLEQVFMMSIFGIIYLLICIFY